MKKIAKIMLVVAIILSIVAIFHSIYMYYLDNKYFTQQNILQSKMDTECTNLVNGEQPESCDAAIKEMNKLSGDLSYNNVYSLSNILFTVNDVFFNLSFMILLLYLVKKAK
jgi:hypothetical protein